MPFRCVLAHLHPEYFVTEESFLFNLVVSLQHLLSSVVTFAWLPICLSQEETLLAHLQKMRWK